MTDDRVAAFRKLLAEYAQHGNMRMACDASGINKRTAYDWVQRSEENPDDPRFQIDGVPFHEALKTARDDAADLLEQEALRRAVHGVDEPVISTVSKMVPHVGKDGVERMVERRETAVVATRKVYSDRLLEKLLAAARPERFRDNPRVNVAVATKIEITESSRQRLAEKLTLAIERREAAQLTDGALPSTPEKPGALVPAEEKE